MNIKNGKKGNVIKDYVIIGDPIGEGSFGKVFLVQNLKSKNYYAAKMLNIEKILERPDAKRKLIRELKILMKMSHPNIARLYDIIRSQKHLYFILEYCDGENLQDVLQTNLKCFKTGFSQKLVKHLVMQIVEGLHKFSELGVIHRDLKLANIMLCFDNYDYHSLNLNFNSQNKKLEFNQTHPDINFYFLKEMNVYETLEIINPYNIKNKENFFSYKKEHFESKEKFEEILLNSKVKIIDLGFARELEEDGAYSFCGTPCTLSPEIFQVGLNKGKNLKYDSRVDIWSLGSIVFNLVTGYPPFLSNDLPGLFKKIINGDYKISKNLRVSLEFLDFINGLLQVNPDDRFSWEEILGHPFIKKNEEKFIIVNFETNSFDNISLTNNLKCESKIKDLFSFVFKVSNLNENSEFMNLNANRRYEFLKNFNEIIINESFYASKSENDSHNQISYNISENKINEHKEDNQNNEKIIIYKIKTFTEESKTNKYYQDKDEIIKLVENRNNIESDKKINLGEVIKDYFTNEKKDFVEKIEEKNEGEISDSYIENKLDFIIIEITYEMFENEEGFIVVSCNEKET